MQQSRQSYRNWKWRVLFARRPFYFNLLQIFLSLQWLGVHFNLNREELSPTFIFVFAFEYGKGLLLQNKGKRLCEWSAFSLVSVAYCLVLLQREETKHQIFNSSMICFPMTSAVSMLVLHHIGIPEPVIILIKLAVVLMWAYFLSISHMNIPEILATLMTIFALHTFGSLLEHEFFRAFRKQNEAERNVYGSGGNQYFIKDASHALKAVNEINQQIFASDTDSLVQISPVTARIMEIRYICSALQYALLDEDFNTENYSQFPFKKVCHHVFSVLESAYGGGLTLYTDENAPEVVITGPKAIFETIIFLCVFDYIRGKKNALCCFSCDNGGGEGWTLRLQITEPENERVRIPPLGLSNNDGVAHGDNMSKAVAGSLDIGRNLLLGENLTNKDTATERLANKIASRYLKSHISQSEPEFKEGLKISTRSISLAHDDDICSVMQKSTTVEDNNINGKIAQQKWLLITQRIHDGGSLSEFEEKLNSLTVPVVMMNFSQLMNKQHKSAIAVITEQHITLLSKDAELKYLRESFGFLIVLCEGNSTKTDIMINHTVDAFTCLYSKAPISEVLECVQEVTKSLEPRCAFMDDKSGFSPFSEASRSEQRSARMQPSTDVPSSMRNAQQTLVSSPAPVTKGIPDSVNRWLVLVKRFKAIVTQLKLDEGFTISVLDNRLSQIASLKGDDRKFKEPSDELVNSGVLNGLNSPYKKKAMIIINFFIPMVQSMRQDFQNKKLLNVVKTSAALSAKSIGWGLIRLSFWFTTVQEIVNMLNVLYDKGGGLKDDGDLSFSAFSPVPKQSFKAQNGDLLSDDSASVTSFEDGQLVDFDDEVIAKALSMDSTLASTILEMLDATEIAIWDAALDK